MRLRSRENAPVTLRLPLRFVSLGDWIMILSMVWSGAAVGVLHFLTRTCLFSHTENY